jgi:predicted transcriptional regulator
METAQKLHSTQAAISQYLNSKCAMGKSEEFSNALPTVQVMAVKAAQSLAEGKTTWGEVTANFCRLCSSIFGPKPNETDIDYSI